MGERLKKNRKRSRKKKKVLAFSNKRIYNNPCRKDRAAGYALLAQLVEHLTLNQGVRGSSPRRRRLVKCRKAYEKAFFGTFIFSNEIRKFET